MAHRSIIDRVRALDLPDGEYIVIGSGVMDALGLRESQDVDLVVSERLFGELRQRGWREDVEHGQPKLMHDEAEAWTTWSFRGGDMMLDGLNTHVSVIEGIAFVSPQFLLAWKKDADRTKDRPDVKLLEEYLAHGA